MVVVIIAAVLGYGAYAGWFKPSSNSSAGPTYGVTFSETGLPGGTSWSVTLGGTTQSSTTANITFSEKNGTYEYTVGSVTGYLSSPASGFVTVAGTVQTVIITFSAAAPGTYSVDFSETGLPTATSWSVTLAGHVMNSTGGTITFSEKNGTFAYSVGSVSGYTASPLSGNLTVAGPGASVTVTFTKSAGFGGAAYPVTFAQTGLPGMDLWSALTISKSGSTGLLFGVQNTGSTTEYAIPDGTYSWSADSQGSGYQAEPQNGSFTVAGHPVMISLAFEPEFPIYFNETGLPFAATWSVNLSGAVQSSSSLVNITTSEVNGTYPFTVSALGYAASPPSGSAVVNGGPAWENISFTPVTTYLVKFTESGLKSGTFWSVVVNQTFNASLAPGSVGFELPNGSYMFTVPAPAGYSVSPASGPVTVSGSTMTIPIAFSLLPTYEVTFTETGLAAGTNWSVFFDGTLNFSLAPGSIGFVAPKGLNSFYNVSATGYAGSPWTGNVNVTGPGVMEPITFTPTHVVTFSETGLPASSNWSFSLFGNGAVERPGYFCGATTFTGAPMLNCSVVNGYYSWTVTTTVPDFTANPMSGWFTVSGQPLNESVTFSNTAGDYLVAFSEDWYLFSGLGGLPNGTSWSVTMGGVTQNTEGMFLFFLEPNGTTNAYTITAPAGYVALPSSGNVTGYSNSSQSWNYPFTSPSVALVFAPSDPPLAGVSSLAESGPSITGHEGFFVAATRHD